MPVLAICYDPIYGNAFSDRMAELTVLKFVRQVQETGEPSSLETSTSNIILAARALIASGRLPSDKISFWFEGAELEHDRQGCLLAQPRGFCDYETDWLLQILKGRGK